MSDTPKHKIGDFSDFGPPDPRRFAARAEDIKMITLGKSESFLTPEQEAANERHEKLIASMRTEADPSEDEDLGLTDPLKEPALGQGTKVPGAKIYGEKMQPTHFPPEVVNKLKWYVYRLVDPRNGQTFYVGKGQGNRVFQHTKGALSTSGDDDPASLKYQRIKDITAAGLMVGQVIHRHGIDSDKVAFEVEAALLDAYPGLTNLAGGHGSGDYGARHAMEIIAEYTAKPFEAVEALILISIGKSYGDEAMSIYDAVRGCWVIDVHKARKHKLVLAHRRGIVVGAFRPSDWRRCTKADFPLNDGKEARWGFVGETACAETQQVYLQKRVPEKYRVKGNSNPIRYIEPEPIKS